MKIWKKVYVTKIKRDDDDDEEMNEASVYAATADTT